MQVINARNVNEAYRLAANMVGAGGMVRNSRNGPVYEMGSVTTMYHRPTERVLFDADRDANPFFHFFESLWILAGRDDVDWLHRFNSNIAQFSDDGQKFYGAYGHRLRNYFNLDQIKEAIKALNEDPTSRRVVMGIWDPELDLITNSKDIPCNMLIKFEIRDYMLNMIVFNRSNDMIWGCYGANAVHFSYLQEYVARHLGVEVGVYEQVSGNFHAYLSTWTKHKLDHTWRNSPGIDPYEMCEVEPYKRFMVDPQAWDEELLLFCNQIGSGPDVGAFTEPFFNEVAVPLFDSWEFWQDREIPNAIEAAKECHATDWSLACQQWLARRQK